MHKTMILHHAEIGQVASCVLLHHTRIRPGACSRSQVARGARKGINSTHFRHEGQEVVKRACRGRSMSGDAYYITAACPGTVVTKYAFACLHDDCNSRSWRNCSAHRARQKARGLWDALGDVVRTVERFWCTRHAPVWDLVC